MPQHKAPAGKIGGHTSPRRQTSVVMPAADEWLLTSKELLQRVPVNRATIWRMVQDGRFPAPIQLTASRIAWRWSAILEWLDDREKNPLQARSYFKRTKRSSAPAIEPEAGR